MVETNSFGEWVTRRRKALDLTRVALARRVGCATGTIKKIERDERRPSHQIAGLLANILAIPPEEQVLFLQVARGERPVDRLCPVSAPLTSLPPRRHNLPVPSTSFIGRQDEIAAVCELARQPAVRLLTLTGPGGVGKTRLALQAATKLQTDFPDGVWLVELAPLSEPTLVIQRVAVTFDIRDPAGSELLEALIRTLEGKRLLILLDNCEHLIETCARMTHALLAACPELFILATSREPLTIAGEVTWLVAPLALPDQHSPPSLEELSQVESVSLFLERAKQVQPTFHLSDTNVPAIVQICCRLDGIPLALELAAARVGVLSVKEIAGRLDDRFRLLTGGNRAGPTRQQTLRATLDWSHALLSETEQVLFRRLCIFSGGWTLSAAEEICAGDDLDAGDVLEALTQLVKKSLVSVEQKPGQDTRYRTLETVRQYAQKKLSQAGEQADLHDRHLDYYLRLAEKMTPALRTGRRLDVQFQLAHDLDNIRAALSWAGSVDQSSRGLSTMSQSSRENACLRLATALEEIIYVHGLYNEGHETLKKALANLPDKEGQSITVIARAWFAAGRLALHLREFPDARQAFEQSITQFRSAGDRLGVSQALGYLAMVVADERNKLNLARCLVEESLAIAREVNDRYTLAETFFFHARIACEQRDYAAALASAQESIALYHETGDHWSTFLPIHILGRICYEQGDYANARQYFEQSLEGAREIGDQSITPIACQDFLGYIAYYEGEYWQMEASYLIRLSDWRTAKNNVEMTWVMRQLGIATLRQGDLQRSREYYRKSLKFAYAAGDTYAILTYLMGCTGILLAVGQLNHAARFLGKIAAELETFFKPLDPIDKCEYQHHLAATQGGMSAKAFTAAREAGQNLTLEQTVHEAQVVLGGLELARQG